MQFQPPITETQLLDNQDWLFGIVFSIVRDRSLAEDVVQSTYEEALKAGIQEKQPRDFRNWLGGIARNLSLQTIRGESRRRRRERKAAIPDSAVLRNSSEVTEMFRIASTAIQDLPELERKALLLRHMQDWKPGEIAEELGLELSQTYRILERGRKSIRGRLQSRYGSDWKAFCTGLLGIGSFSPAPTHANPTSSGSFPGKSFVLPALSIAGVGLAITLLLNSGVDPIAPGVQEALAAPALLSQDDLAGSHLLRSATTSAGERLSATTGWKGFDFLVLKPDGMPCPGAIVLASWRDPVSGETTENASSDGRLSLDLPTDKGKVTIRFAGQGYSGKAFHLDLQANGVQELQLVEGTHLLKIDSDSNVAGLPYLVESDPYFFGEFGWTTFLTTDSSGVAMFHAPEPGSYHIFPFPKKGTIKDASIWVGASTGGRAATVPHGLPGRIQITAVGQSGIRLAEAEFFPLDFVRDGNAEMPLVGQALASQGGVLSLSAEEREGLESGKLLVQAPGHQRYAILLAPTGDVIGEVRLPIEESMPALFETEHGRPALAEVVLEREIPTVTIGDHGHVVKSSPAGRERLPLAETTLGGFLLPRSIDASGGNFRIHAKDQLGLAYESDWLAEYHQEGPNLEFDLRPVDSGGESTITLAGPRIEAVDTVKIHRTDVGVPAELLQAQQEGNFRIATRAGESFLVQLFTDEIELMANVQLPSGSDSVDYRISIQGGHAIRGTVAPFGGEELPDGMRIRATYRGEEALEPGAGLSTASLVFPARLAGGRLEIQDCPPGEYQLTLEAFGTNFQTSITSGEEFHWPLEEHQEVLIHGTSTDGSPLKGFSVFDLSSTEDVSYPHSFQSISSDLGWFAQCLPTRLRGSRVAVAVMGHEVQVIEDLQFGMVIETRLRPGRTVRMDLPPLGMSPTEGNRWLCSTWGAADDPRHRFIEVSGERIVADYLPITALTLVEVDSFGEETGNRIDIPPVE